MGTLFDHQRHLNRTTMDRWAEYASHRDRITRLLLSVPVADPPRLCVLGAGNVNDLDLAALLTRFAQIRLIDLDEEAVRTGVARQGFDGDARIRVDCRDVTGVLEPFDWSPETTLAQDDLDEAANASAAVASSIGTFEVASSLGLLSQLMLAVARGVGEAHPQFIELLQAVRIGHLRMLAELTVPGGTGLLVTDVVSSDTCPELAAVSNEQLPSVISREVQRRNFFHGVNPFVVEKLLRADHVFASRVGSVVSLPPWKWDIGPRVYAVCGFLFRSRL